MGARAKRSTLSAIELLTGTIETAWKTRESIVSVLGLDLAGAFDNVSWERLLWILRMKGFPDWIIIMVGNFLKGRRTKFSFSDHLSQWYSTATGIPQGSTLSPVLFLFFISELLEKFTKVQNGLLGFGFVDDTTLIAWSNSAKENCARLTEAHQECEKWAKRYGAKFAPDKYQLIHFTKKKRITEDLTSTVEIQCQKAELTKELRVLGVWLDPSLSWKTHIEKAAQKGQTAFHSMARITASTWGPSVRRSKLLYTAVARPIMTYGSQIWAVAEDGHATPETRLSKIRTTQNKCLKRIMGAYKRTPTAAVERESGTPPITEYIQLLATQRAVKTERHPVTSDINQALQDVHRDIQERRGQNRRGRKRMIPSFSPTSMQNLRERSRKIVELQREKRENELTERQASKKTKKTRNTGQRTIRQVSPVKELDCHFMGNWRTKWQNEASKTWRKETTWTGTWEKSPAYLYEGLLKHEATALFLLRTQVIGLRQWLARIGVPDTDPICDCREGLQTVRHIFGFCKTYATSRAVLQLRIQETQLDRALNDKAKAHHVAKWFLQTGVLKQFQLANEIEEEDYEDWAPASPI